jgi:hypothetical protein
MVGPMTFVILKIVRGDARLACCLITKFGAIGDSGGHFMAHVSRLIQIVAFLADKTFVLMWFILVTILNNRNRFA